MYYPSRSERSDISSAFRAAASSSHRCRHGALIRSSGRRTVGFNKLKNNPKFVPDLGIWGVHAEQHALKLHSNPRGGLCISVRINREGRIAYARPCEHCEADLVEAGIRKVIYSNPSSSSGFSLMKL